MSAPKLSRVGYFMANTAPNSQLPNLYSFTCTAIVGVKRTHGRRSNDDGSPDRHMPQGRASLTDRSPFKNEYIPRRADASDHRHLPQTSRGHGGVQAVYVSMFRRAPPSARNSAVCCVERCSVLNAHARRGVTHMKCSLTPI